MQNTSVKSERISALKVGDGLQSLIDKAYEILGNPILIHDMEYKVTFFNKGVDTDDPIWNEYTTTGTVDNGWLDFFKNECFIEDAANAKTITFLTSKKLKYDRIYCKVFNKNNIQVGCAVLLACDKPFEYDDPKLFENLCAIISAEIGNIEFYNEYGQRYFEKLVEELICGISDTALYTAHVESIYMHLNPNLYLAVADIGKHDSEYSEIVHFRDMFKKTQPEYAYAIYGNHILIIIGTDDRVLNVDKDLNPLNCLFREHNIYAGVSSSFENLFELNKYYKEAVDALNGVVENSTRHIFLHE